MVQGVAKNARMTFAPGAQKPIRPADTGAVHQSKQSELAPNRRFIAPGLILSSFLFFSMLWMVSSSDPLLFFVTPQRNHSFDHELHQRWVCDSLFLLLISETLSLDQERWMLMSKLTLSIPNKTSRPLVKSVPGYNSQEVSYGQGLISFSHPIKERAIEWMNESDRQSPKTLTVLLPHVPPLLPLLLPPLHAPPPLLPLLHPLLPLLSNTRSSTTKREERNTTRKEVRSITRKEERNTMRREEKSTMRKGENTKRRAGDPIPLSSSDRCHFSFRSFLPLSFLLSVQ